MKKIINAREASLLALNRVEDEGAFINLALAEVLGAHQMDPRDKRLAAEITYGVVSYKMTLDWLISQAAGRPVSKLDKLVLTILRIGFYQLFYLDRVPESAACNATVELIKKSKKKGLASFVNGVMRGALRKKDTFPWPDRDTDEVGYLSLKYAHPHWLVSRWVSRLGSEEAEALLAANNRPAPLSVRTNTLRVTRPELIEALEGQGVKAVPGEVTPEDVILEGSGRLTGLMAYRSGYFQVQGESAMLTSRILDPAPGEQVLDGCSAPGGKTTHLAQLMENQGKIVALDIYPHRLTLVDATCRRLGIDIVRTQCLDVREATEELVGVFDRILLDVPCSGFGVIRRKPDLKWRRKEENIKELSNVQKAILNAAAGILKPGGIIVYSTCTNEPEETDEVITSFLSSHSDFGVVAQETYLPKSWQDSAGEHGIHLYPHIHGVDGFFISRLQKKL
ncbi:MAG: 16S rRNA (cytosine(967)-C(5))-methyltransferase RsmB [Clostridiales bacterium]|jgi:16S rRNA (cytosine967-C5)-methyltransferase|nr:16S rRNA (cytosine(967)-C(5))-methyltransferase RsmB [Clostridiales bacterium]